MLALAEAGAGEGLWLRAEQQTSGRGRLGRHWESPAGNLHCSTLVRLRPGDPPPATLALVMAVAAHQALAPHFAQGRLFIKWPNDLLVVGAKICGMLLERAGDAIVIGVGINVTGHPTGLDRPVTSLWAEGAVDAQAGSLLQALAEHFSQWLQRWRNAGLSPVRACWIDHAHPLGTALRANLPDGTVMEGQFAGLDEHGALILRLPNGGNHIIHAGDVFLL